MSGGKEMPEAKSILLPNYQEVLLSKLAQLRGRETSDYKVLKSPSPTSPFLTLAEYQGQVLPTQVIKLLLVFPEDPARPGWEAILRSEEHRLSKLFESKFFALRRQSYQAPDGRVRELPFPLMLAPGDPRSRVEIDALLDLRRDELLAESQGKIALVSFPCLVRPFVPLPSLSERASGSGLARMVWDQFCRHLEIKDLSDYDQNLFRNFLSEALVGGNLAKGDPLERLFLTSAWRYRLRSGEKILEHYANEEPSHQEKVFPF
jgi:hypothetical protein